jgi:alkylhydroperoxidase family enzyme
MPSPSKPARKPASSNGKPALLNALARSPAALAGYLGLQAGLSQGRLSAIERNLIGLAVAQRSGSRYWLSVQVRMAEEAGLTSDQILDAREGCADLDRHVAVLFLAGKLVINRGELADADLAAVRQVGLSDADVTEVIAHVALNLTAASVSHAARLQPAPSTGAAKSHTL